MDATTPSSGAARDGNTSARIRAIVAELLYRRATGEVVSDDSLLAAYPELASELSAELRRLQLTKADGATADAVLRSAAATISQRDSDTGKGRLDVRCPGCRAPMDVEVDTQLTDLTCSACGSHFSLVDQSQETRFAPALTKLGRFELIERIGVGGFGSVWKARDKELDRTVAIKIPRHSGMNAEEQELFFREARAAAQLRHPSIVSVHEVGRDGDSIYIVSDFVRGVTLADWISGQQLTSREAAELCAKIADALEHAHENGIVHRDLKPANIMIDGDGEPHLMDFGLARREAGEVTVTADGQVLGTPAYMSPEQAEGKGHAADRRSDVYSLGVILFQLLTGELPFRGNARMIMHQVINDDAPSPRKLNGNIARDLETIVLKCLKKEPSRRYPTSRELCEDLRRFLSGEPILARPVGRAERALRWVRRNRVVSALSSAVAVALILGSVVSSYFAIKAQRQANVAIAREKEAKAVTDLLVESFESANPYQGGSTVTAAELLEHAQQRLDVELANQPLARAALLDALGRALLGLGQIDQAIGALTKAKETREKLLGGDHPDTLTTANNLGDAYYAANRFSDAIELFEHVLASRREILGPDHADTLTSTHDLAVTLSSSGKRDAAIKLHEENLAARQRALGPDHPDTLKTMYNLATAYHYQGNSDDAVPLFERTLAARRQSLGDEHPDTLRSMNGLADAYVSANRRKDAIPLYEECLAGRTRKLGADHPHTAATLKGLADAYYRSGDVDKAIPLYEQGVAIRRKKFGDSHASTRSIINALLTAYSSAGRHEDVIKLTSEGDSPLTGQLLAWRASSQSHLGNWQAATEDYLSAINEGVVPRDFAVDQLATHIASIAQSKENKDGYVRLRDLFKKLIDAGPKNDPWIRNNTAWVFVRYDSSDDDLIQLATRMAEEARTLSSDEGSILNTLGVCYFRAGKWQEAIDTLQLSRYYQKMNVVSFDGYFLAMSFAKAEDPERAKRWFDASDRWMALYDPDNDELRRIRPEAAKALGLEVRPLQPALGTDEEKKNLVTLLVETDPKAGWTHQALGQWALQHGKKDVALDEFRLATERYASLADEYPDVRLFRSDLLQTYASLVSLKESSGDLQGADADYQKALAIQSELAGRFSGFAGTLLPTRSKWDVQFYKIKNGMNGGVPIDWAATIAQDPLADQSLNRIDLNWYSRAPAANVPADQFATIASTELELDAGTYEVQTLSDDGVRVWIDGRVVIDNWAGHPETFDRSNVTLATGKHKIKIEHFDSAASATLRFGMSPKLEVSQ